MVTMISMRVKNEPFLEMIDRVRGTMTRSDAIKKLLNHSCFDDKYVKDILGITE